MTGNRATDLPSGGWGTGGRILLYLALVILGMAALGPLLPGGLVGGSLARLVAALGAGWILLAFHGRRPGALGFGLRRTAPAELARGTALGTLLLAPVLGVLLLAGGVAWHAEAGSAGAWLGAGLESLALLTLPAAGEEVLIRGYPLQVLAGALGPAWALATTSAVFGLAHLGNPGSDWLGAVNVATAGMFLGVLVLRTGSLWWATGAHLGWNWGQAFLADLPVSGIEVVDTPFWDGALSGPAWLAGGAFGVEGSILTTLVMGAAAWMCWRTARLEPAADRWWKHEDEKTAGGDSAGSDTDKESEA